MLSMKKYLLCAALGITAYISQAQLPGNSFRSSGSGAQYVTIPDASNLIVNNLMTIEAWVYYACENGTNSFNIFNKGWCGTPDWTIGLAIDEKKIRLAKWRNGYNSCAGGHAVYYSVDEVVPYNTWTHVAITINATAASNIITFYVNGISVPNTLTSGTDGIGWNASTFPFLVGSYRSLSNVYSVNYGNIDDLRIWHTVRTGAEIAANAETELNGTEPNLQYYWKLNETGSGAGITAVNSGNSGAAFNGTTVGANAAFTDNSTIEDMLPACNPVLWMDAGVGTTADGSGNLLQWNDRSPLNNHATQSTAVNRPRLKNNELNNKPVVRFDGINDDMATPAVNLSTVQKADVFIVSKATNEGIPLYHASAFGGPNNFHIIENHTNGTNGLSASLQGLNSDNVSFKSNNSYACFKRYQVTFDKALTGLAQIAISVNGLPITNSNGVVSGAEMTNNLGNFPFTIGGAIGSAPLHFNGDIAEIIVYNKVLTATERNAMNSYLSKKYFSSKLSTQFSNIPVTETASDAVTDDGTWRHSYNSSQPANIIASVKDNCLTPGPRTDTVFFDATATVYGGKRCLRRHYVVNPAADLPGTKRVRLYYSNADFADLQSYIPALTSHGQLVVTKYNGPAEDGIYDPTGGTLTFIPAAEITTGNAYGNRYLEFDVDGFSEFWIHTGTEPIPVVLGYFGVKQVNHTGVLNWHTVTEQNSHSFEVERSTDGSRYTNIGSVPAAGNSSQLRKYQFADQHPEKGINYYRLRQVDNDGQWKLSEVKKLDFTTGSHNLHIYHDFAQGGAAIIKTGHTHATLSILDITGRKMKDLPMHSGMCQLKPGSLPVGVYVVVLREGDKVIETGKLVMR